MPAMKSNKYEQKIYDYLDNPKCHLANLYQQDWVKYKGRSTDRKELYSELFAKVLFKELKNREGFIRLIDSIKSKRKLRYSVDSHEKRIKQSDTNRKEENLAKSLIDVKLCSVGMIFDYQIPLAASRKDEKVGRIDLISVKGKRANIIELKAKDNKSDTLISSVLEIMTYWCQLDKKQFLQSFNNYYKEIRNKTAGAVIPVVLLEKGCRAYEEAVSVSQNNRPWTASLISALKVSVYSLDMVSEKII